MRYEYQDDVDTLVILFEEGVVGIYEGKKLVGVEILDITGGLAHANPP